MKLFVLAGLAAWQPAPVYADDVTPPDVPGDLRPPEGSKAFLVGHAYGTQNYVCLPSGSGVGFALFTPEATLLDDDGEQIITHFFSPNPGENGTVRATWEHSRDTSRFFGAAVASSTDAKFVAQDAIPWVLLARAGPDGVQVGPTGGDVLTKTTFVQRVNTAGGIAPPTGCSTSADIGKKAFVPYTADYFFYKG